MLKVSIYKTKTNKDPFINWLEGLETKTQGIVLSRIAKLRLGNFGNCKIIKRTNIIFELRIDYGSVSHLLWEKRSSSCYIAYWW